MYFIEERIKRILKELKDYIYQDPHKITEYKSKKGYFKCGEATDLDTSVWEEYDTSKRWGGYEEKDRHYWFRTEIVIPEVLRDKEVVYHMTTGEDGDWDLANPQMLVYLDGQLIQGLDIRHREFTVTHKAIPGTVYQLAIQAYCGIRGGMVDMNSYITAFDRKVEALYYDIKVPMDVIEHLDSEDIRRIDMLKYMENAVNLIDLRKPCSKEFHASVIEAHQYLETVFYQQFCGREAVAALCVGHTHIDVAWLWTVKQTREKVARSFSTVLKLMEEYPEYIFMSSQPQLYQYVKEDYPEVYEQIKAKVKEGRWEPEGAMWLEADCNLISGESMIRQILHGKRFFEAEFGIKNEILWLPDVFGYSAALPQILKKSGIKYFMTTKLGWNEYNGIPYDTFIWKGIDGSEVLTHMITTQDPKFNITPHATSYNGHIIPSNVIGAWKRYHQKELSKEVLIAYGYGDGGGGPTREMLENAKRLKQGIPGCPKVKLGKSIDFFQKLETQVKNNKRLPKWTGELYLEYHRGTYTSMARNKRDNRKSEILYQNAELFSVLADEVTGSHNYPKIAINSGWKTILLNQFHDILPGSAIKEVYEDTLQDYQRVLSEGQRFLYGAMEKITSAIQLKKEALIVFNALSTERTDLLRVKVPSGLRNFLIIDDMGKNIVKQVVGEAAKIEQNEVEIVFLAEQVPPMGYKTYYITEQYADQEVEELHGDLVTTKKQMSNRFFDITFDVDGNINSIYDKIEKRQVLKPNSKANVFQVFEDKPHNYDAWDINVYYQEKMWELFETDKIDIVENGPVLGSLRITKKFMDSEIVQDITIYKDIPRIDFISRVDWQERQMLLKVKFPLDIYGDKAAFDIQYGNVERMTHKNTSWDFARFEVCAHKWVDISEDGYGVSLLNDCKYGHDINEGDLRLTLIKSAIDPNENADREIHEFTYALYPHQGNWKSSGTVTMAYELNNPMYSCLSPAHDGVLPDRMSLVSVDRENVIIEVMKEAESGHDRIIRLYECFGRRTQCQLKWFKTFSEIYDCDLMENNISLCGKNSDCLNFEIKPYEIKTFKLIV